MDPEIYERVRRITIEETGCSGEEATPNTHFFDDLDCSLDFEETIMACEDEFGIKLPDEDAREYLTIGSLAIYITTKLGRTPPEGDASQIISGYPRPRPKSR